MITKIQALPLPLRVVCWLCVAMFLLPVCWVIFNNMEKLIADDDLASTLTFLIIFLSIPLFFLYGLIVRANSVRWTLLLLAFLAIFRTVFVFTNSIIDDSLTEYTQVGVLKNVIYLLIGSVIIWGLLHSESKPHFVKKNKSSWAQRIFIFIYLFLLFTLAALVVYFGYFTN